MGTDRVEEGYYAPNPVHRAELQCTAAGADTNDIDQRNKENAPTETAQRLRNQWQTTTTPKKCTIYLEGRHIEE